jgi:hypothetical protein
VFETVFDDLALALELLDSNLLFLVARHHLAPVICCLLSDIVLLTAELLEVLVVSLQLLDLLD